MALFHSSLPRVIAWVRPRVAMISGVPGFFSVNTGFLFYSKAHKSNMGDEKSSRSDSVESISTTSDGVVMIGEFTFYTNI